MLCTEKHLRLPDWVRQVKSSAMEKSLTNTRKKDFISFALGLPAIELFPRELCQRVTNDVIINEQLAFQYTPPSQELKSHIVKLMRLRGVSCKEEQVLLTAGAQQGINLLIRLLLEPGGNIILEELAYPGALQAMQPFSPDILTVKTDPKTGIDVNAVEDILKNNKRVRFIYVVTEGGNPHAVSIEKSKRIYLAQLAQIYGVPIIEDDPYGFVTYENPVPPIKYFGGDWVFYVGSFSKILAPSFRVGWIVVPEHLIPKLSSLKEATDINTMTFTQHVVKRLLDLDLLPEHFSKIRDSYRRKRDCMIAALASVLPADAEYHVPSGGIFVWANLPKHINTSLMLDVALAKANVAFIPSESFCATNKISIKNGLRLNFSHPSEQLITSGLERLRDVFNQFV